MFIGLGLITYVGKLSKTYINYKLHNMVRKINKQIPKIYEYNASITDSWEWGYWQWSASKKGK